MNLFVYGSLKSHALCHKILGYPLKGKKDQLDRFIFISAYSEGTYPGIAPSPYACVKGIVYRVTPLDIKKLDAYEGEEYDKIWIKTKNGKRCLTYACKQKLWPCLTKKLLFNIE